MTPAERVNGLPKAGTHPPTVVLLDLRVRIKNRLDLSDTELERAIESVETLIEEIGVLLKAKAHPDLTVELV